MAAAQRIPRVLSSLRVGARPQHIGRVRALRPARGYASETATEAGGGNSKAIVGGIVGGLLVFTGGYGWYYFSGAKTAVNSVHQTKQYFEKAAQKVQDSAPEPNEALQWLRQTAQTYAAFIPGAKGYVDTAFNDLDAIHKKHGSEVDKIVSDTYNKLKEITKSKGIALETAVEGWNVLEDGLKKIASLAGDAIEDVLENHPQLKERVGGDIQQLKSMGEKYGPEAKEQVEKTWDEIRSTVSKGFNANTVQDVSKIVREKIDMLKKKGEEAFDKGLEEAKPYLEKSPKAKELIEQNKDALKQGDVATLWKKVKEAADSGSTDDLESFVKSAADKAKQGGSDLANQLPSYLKMIPGAGDISSKLQRLQEIGQKHGKEAEDLLNSTIKEVKQVLDKKVQDAEGLANKAKKEAEN